MTPHEEALALNKAHDREVEAWAKFKKLRNERTIAEISAAFAFDTWVTAREQQKSLGGECS